MKPGARVFQATLERIDSPLQWVMARVPFDAGKVWGTRGQLRVKGEINGFTFRASLFPDGKGGHRLLVTKAMLRGAKAAPGMTAKFRVAPDSGRRAVAAPAEFKRTLSQERSLRKWYDGLSPSMRNEICKWIGQAKSSSSRSRRAEQMAERLLSTMEAERELPPALQLALQHNSLAHEGWQLMSHGRRRGHLLGIFYYQSVEARVRRTSRMLEDAVRLAQRRKKKSENQK
ncbi:MAG: YdeI/OmpD-associated family protein [Acidobacteriia bacterium]|nr:YdeI/OmpD-associated family protein [Terriglobia bacterium]